MMKDKCICYIGMATRLALLRVHWQLYLRNMYPWHIYTNFYFYIYIYMYISTSAPIFTKTTHLIWKYCTSWFSSFTIYYKLCCWCGCCWKVSGIDQSSSFRTHSECNAQKYKGIDAIIYIYIYIYLKVIMSYGILNNFLLVVRIIES